MMSEHPRRSKRLRAAAANYESDSDSSTSLYRFPSSDDEDADKCPICLQPPGSSELGYPGDCGHAFCLRCIRRWAASSNTCPVDRARFRRIEVRARRGGPTLRVVPVSEPVDYFRPRLAFFASLEGTANCEVCGGAGDVLDMLVCCHCSAGVHFRCCMDTNAQELPPFEWSCPSCHLRSDESIQCLFVNLGRVHVMNTIPLIERALRHRVDIYLRARQPHLADEPVALAHFMLREQEAYLRRLRDHMRMTTISPYPLIVMSARRINRPDEDRPQQPEQRPPQEPQPSTSSGQSGRRERRPQRKRRRDRRGNRATHGSAQNRADNKMSDTKKMHNANVSGRNVAWPDNDVANVTSCVGVRSHGVALVAAVAHALHTHTLAARKLSLTASPAACANYDIVGVIAQWMDTIMDNKVEMVSTWPGEGCEVVCAAGGGGGGGERRRGAGGWGGGYRGGYSSHQHGPLDAQHYQDMYHRAPAAASSAAPPPMMPPLRPDADKYDPTEPTRDESSADEEEPDDTSSAVHDETVDRRGPTIDSAPPDVDSDGDCPNFSIYSATSVHIADEQSEEPVPLPAEEPEPVEQEPPKEFDEIERRVSRRCPITPNVRTPIKIKLNTHTLAKRPPGLYDDEEIDSQPDVCDDAAPQAANAMEVNDIHDATDHEITNNNHPAAKVMEDAPPNEEHNNLCERDDAKATSSISEGEEDERSYTPCLDENKSKDNSLEIEKENIGIEGLDTEMISEDEGNELFSDGERSDKSRSPVRRESAPREREDGEMTEKRKGLADTSNREEPKRKKKKEPKKNGKEKKLKNKKTDVTFKKLSKNGKERNYRDKEERNNRHSSSDREKARRKEKRKDLQRYDVRSLVGRRKPKDPFGRDVSPSDSLFERRKRTRKSGSPLSQSPKLSPPRRSPTPPRRRSSSRKRRKTISPKPRRSVSRLAGRSVSPRPKRSVSPGHLGLKRSISPRIRRSLSRIARKKSLSPPRRRTSPTRGRRRPRRSPSRTPRPKPIKKKRRSRSRQPEKRSRKNKRKNNSPRRKSPKQKKKKAPKSLSPESEFSPAPWTDAEERPFTWAPGSPGMTPPRRRDPPPSKEVFTSGDNILVSVSFDDEGRRRRRPRRDLPPAKPVAIIDLDRSPFRELTPDPETVIVLSDSSPSPREASPPAAKSPANAPAGPKTPPSPPSPAPHASPAPNPAPEPAREAYDPFEPTKSPEPAPAPILMTLETAQQTNMSADDVVNQRPVSPLEKVLALLQSTRDVLPAPAPYEPPTNIASSPAPPVEPVAELESPYSPGSSDFGDLFSPPAAEGPPSRPSADAFEALFGPKRGAAKNRAKNKRRSKKSEKAQTGVKADEDDFKILDNLPNSAVDMQVKSKFLKKLNRQERVVEEVKLVLKPHYNKKRLSKDEYKDILRRAVPKICHNKSGEINPAKIQALVEAYVRKFRKRRKLGLV